MKLTQKQKPYALYAMWLRSKPAIFFQNMGVKPPEATVEDAQQFFADAAVAKHRSPESVDYWAGRLIKTNFADDPINFRWYNETYGENAAEQAIEEYFSIVLGIRIEDIGVDDAHTPTE